MGHLQIITDWITGAYVEGDPYETCGPFLDALENHMFSFRRRKTLYCLTLQLS